MIKKLKTNKGIALILALSLLVLVSTFTTFFTSKARAELLKANHFKNAAKALYLSEAGIHRGRSELPLS